MAHPIPFETQNAVFTAPIGMTDEEVQKLYARKDLAQVVSCWQFTDEEFQEVVRTGCVWVTVLSGGSTPPIYVSGTPL